MSWLNEVFAVLSRQVDPDELTAGISPPFQAAKSGNTDAVKRLLERGARVDLPVAKGETAIFAAARHCQLRTVELLLANGSNASLESSVRFVPGCNATPLVSLLMEYDQKSEHCGKDEVLEVAKLLKGKGASLVTAQCDYR